MVGDIACVICGQYNCSHWEIGLRLISGGGGGRVNRLPASDFRRVQIGNQGLDDTMMSWRRVYEEESQSFAHDYYDSGHYEQKGKHNMEYIHPLFKSNTEEVSPVQLAEALGFKVTTIEGPDFRSGPDFDNTNQAHLALEALYYADTDMFYEAWNPRPFAAFASYELGGKYEAEDGPFAFFVKPETAFSKLLWETFYGDVE